MTDKKTYRVIVSDRAKRMLGTHIRFLAQVNPQAATARKKELLSAMRSLSQMPHRFPFFKKHTSRRISIIRYLFKIGISSCIKSEMIRCI